MKPAETQWEYSTENREYVFRTIPDSGEIIVENTAKGNFFTIYGDTKTKQAFKFTIQKWLKRLSVFRSCTF